MTLYHCQLTLHDNVFFATREMGILYETEKYLHNWALSYALFSVNYIPLPYRLQGDWAQKPGYLEESCEQNLLPLNKAGLYVFPALPLTWFYQVNTFKAAQTTYYGKSKQFGDKGAERNYPVNYGRAKELGVGSQYRTYLIAPPNFQNQIPQWIRLGKWAAKVNVKVTPIPDAVVQHHSGPYHCQHPLNPLDLSPQTQLNLYNRIVMPPASLVSQAQLTGEYWHSKQPEWDEWKSGRPELPSQLCLPADVSYGASYVATVSV